MTSPLETAAKVPPRRYAAKLASWSIRCLHSSYRLRSPSYASSTKASPRPLTDRDRPATGRAFRRFVGIGLGGGRGKTTAVARLDLAGDDRRLVVSEARTRVGLRGGGVPGPSRLAFRDDVLLSWIREWVDDSTVVAIDAPLTLPPCLTCPLACPGFEACQVPVVVWMRTHAARLANKSPRRDPQKPWVTPYTQRATELLLEHATLAPREALGQGMGPLAARAAFLRRATAGRLRLHENLLEVHPRATLIRRFGADVERRSRRAENETTWEARKQMLESLTEGVAFDRVWPELVVRNVHVFHAVIAAMSAYLWARDGWRGPTDLVPPDGAETLQEAVGELGDLWLEAGWIWTPPAPSES
ncbi:MAG: DUF429 domain-containing protein [Myxococcales bacterium FL481]|nr:MAG: DUF429 domain-containing protein [Myxococcales bacterium FL481]